MAKTQPIIERHDARMTLNYPRWSIAIDSGQGCVLVDADGKEYLDLFSGFGAGILGHCHPDLVAAGTKQMNKLWHVGNLLHTEPQTLLAEQVARKGFGGRSFFSHSGADANEAAVKLARLYGKANPGVSANDWGRYKIISATLSFHGRSFATMGATGNEAVRQGFEPLLPGFVNVEYNSIPAIEAELDETAVAIIVEPIQGEGGVNVPEDNYLPRLRKLCDERDMLLICDEVWTGCGRTGKWFGYQHWGVEPDIMTLGKAVGCGLPLGVMCANERAAAFFDVTKMGRVTHATTLGGNCVTTAVAARMFEVLEHDGLVERAAKLGQTIATRLMKAAKKSPAIRQVRGRGLFLGIELDPAQSDGAFENGRQVVDRCLEQGVMLNVVQGNVIRLAPPLIVTDEQIDRGLDVLIDAIGK